MKKFPLMWFVGSHLACCPQLWTFIHRTDPKNALNLPKKLIFNIEPFSRFLYFGASNTFSHTMYCYHVIFIDFHGYWMSGDSNTFRKKGIMMPSVAQNWTWFFLRCIRQRSGSAGVRMSYILQSEMLTCLQLFHRFKVVFSFYFVPVELCWSGYIASMG